MSAAEDHTMTSTASLGSDAWFGLDEYDPGSEPYERAIAFFAHVKWDILASKASRLRNGVSCKLSEKYSIGQFNMVRRITFSDGVDWVARLRMPDIQYYKGPESLDHTRVMRSELASMRFLKANAPVPVPEVHAYNFDKTNDIGAPYFLLDYINGNTASEMQIMAKSEMDVYGTPEQDTKLRQQMANLQVALSSITFGQIGSLYHDEETSQFFIGRETFSGKGPWTSSEDYYHDMATHALQWCLYAGDDEVRSCPSVANPSIFKHLMSMYGDKNNVNGPFRLKSCDLGVRNVLVNKEFDIVGLIDFDRVMAAPIEVVAQFPAFPCLRPGVPGHIYTEATTIQFRMITDSNIGQYMAWIEAAEARLGKNAAAGAPISRHLLSDGARIYQGLDSYHNHQKHVNDCWMDAYVRYLREGIRAGRTG